MKAGCVYMMANRKNGTIYIGVTSDLAGRAYQHRESLVAGFTKRYGCKLLVCTKPSTTSSRRVYASCK